MDITDLSNSIEFQSLIQQDPQKLALELRKSLFKNGNFDFIVKGIANNNEGNFIKGKEATHEKQKEALKTLTSNEYDQFLYGGAAGGAKILANNGVVLTPHGWKKGKDIKVGDLLNNPDGTIQRIINIKPEIYVDQWTVYFSDGTSTDVGKEHLWQAWRGSKGRKINNVRTFGEKSAEVIQTDELKEWLDRGYKPQIPVCKPQKFNFVTKEKNRVDPYLLGILLGDGCLTSKNIMITSDSHDLKHYIENIGDLDYSVGKNRISFIGETNKWLKNKIKLHGLNGKKSLDKFIPKSYKWSSVEDRYSLLQGLMDTDGTSAKDKNAISYTTISKKLANDVAFVVRSLGGTVTINKNKAGYKDDEGNYIECNDAYRLYIRMRNPNKAFRLKRKQFGKFGKNLVQKRVINVKITGKIKGRCITVSNPNGLYITNDFIVTHNSFTGMSWIVFSALCYPNTRYFIARNELKDIRESVLVTFGEVCDYFGIKDYKYNSVLNFIKFSNGSEINLIEVKYKPSDPEYKDVGSTLYTSGWFEEVGEIHEKAVSVLTTRVNRWNVDKYDLKGIVFLTGNPSKNWTKSKFYDKDKNKQLEIDNLKESNFKKKYLGCLVTENPFISQRYIDSLRKQASNDVAIFERLFKGNWDYDDNPYQLAEQEMIEQIFENNHVAGGKGYIIADVARFGNDKAIIGYWSGWDLRDVITLDVSKTTDIELAILTLRKKYKVPKNRVLVDDDGVGGGVTDGTGGIGFKNASKPIKITKETPNYKNLQVQCLYLLADKINEGGLYISADLTQQQKDDIKTELAQIQAKGDHDPQRKLDCKSKGDIKQDIGRSPDWRDMIMMRVFFDLKKTKLKLTTTWS